MTDRIIWNSPVCGCRVLCSEIDPIVSLCTSCVQMGDAEGMSIYMSKMGTQMYPVGLQKLREKERITLRLAKIGYGDEFATQLQRWLRSAPPEETFFKMQPSEPEPKGFPADLVMYSWESTGVRLPCSEPEIMARYEQGKAIKGLMEKMWKEDCRNDTEMMTCFPEELVVDGQIGFNAVCDLVGRDLNGTLLWISASDGVAVEGFSEAA